MRSRSGAALGPIWTPAGKLPVEPFTRRAPRLDCSKVTKERRRLNQRCTAPATSGLASRQPPRLGSRPRPAPRGDPRIRSRGQGPTALIFLEPYRTRNSTPGLQGGPLCFTFCKPKRRDSGIVQVREKSRVRLLTTSTAFPIFYRS